MERNKTAVRRIYEEGLNQRKLEIIDEIVGADFITPGPDGGTGPDGFRSNLARLISGFPDIRFTIHELLAEKAQVAVYWTWEGTHRGVFAGIPATNKPVRQEGMVMYRFKAGKAVSAKLIFDRLGVFQQLGATPAQTANPNFQNQKQNA